MRTLPPFFPSNTSSLWKGGLWKGELRACGKAWPLERRIRTSACGKAWPVERRSPELMTSASRLKEVCEVLEVFFIESLFHFLPNEIQ